MTGAGARRTRPFYKSFRFALLSANLAAQYLAPAW
jgi:hypothetical protein